MPSQRSLLGTGLVVLLLVSAASVGLDLKSRYDAVWVNHSLGMLARLPNLRLLACRAQDAARDFALTHDPKFAEEYHRLQDRMAPAFARLRETVRDSSAQMRLLESSETLVTQRPAIGGESVQLPAAGDTTATPAPASETEGRTPMATVNANFDKLIAEQEKLFAARTADSQRTRNILLAIDLAGAGLILILAVMLIREARRSRRELETSLRATEATNETLEAAVAERTEHLLAAHRELQHSVAIMQSTFNSMSDAVLVIGPNEKILFSNQATERLLHYRLGMTGNQLRAANIPYQADGSTQLAKRDRPADRALRGEQFDGLEVVFRQPDNRDPRYVVVSGRPLHDSSGAPSGAVLIYRDVTAARETERKLQQSQKLDAIGKLTGGVAHDFNNMLTVITGTTETLVAGLKNQPELLRTAALIDRAAERCTELIQHLLAFARKQPLQPRNVDINGTILDMANLLRPTLGEQVEIETILERTAAVSYIDPSQLANSLLNMAINARDAMPNGGKLVLETRNTVLGEAYANANADVRPGPYVELTVRDSGIGMSAEVRDKVFEPFFTTKEVGKGSGLGLSMVYGFVKQSGGHIKIHSELGLGTTIRLYLPLARGPVDADIAAPAPVPGGGTETILVVEDDSLVRNFVTTQLQSLGYKTVTAADSRAALAHVESNQQFDLLFTDVVMPGGITGRELAEQVSKRRPGTKVLYTSGYTDKAIVHDGRLDEGIMLLPKPYRMSQLSQMVRRALGGEVGPDPRPHRGAAQDRVDSPTPASVKAKAASWPKPSGSCSAKAEATTPITGTAIVPIAATEAGSRARAANHDT
jgi:PAS domain S-box-containing protein